MSAIKPEAFYAALQSAMQAEIEKALAAEIDGACDRLRETLRAKVGSIALSMINHYRVYERENVLVIEVRNDR